MGSDSTEEHKREKMDAPINSYTNETNKPKSDYTKEGIIIHRPGPISREEMQMLYSYEDAICKIEYETKKDGEKKIFFGTGFFCEIHDKKIPFSKALFINNHILDEHKIKKRKQIKLEYLKKKRTIDITVDRKIISNADLDYTCVQIFDEDKISKFFSIGLTNINDKNKLQNQGIFILQYINGELSTPSGKILNIKNNILEHNAYTNFASGPLIMRYNINQVVGINLGPKKSTFMDNNNSNSYIGIPFDAIIKDIIEKSNNNIDFNRDRKINLIYKKDIGNPFCNNIFGDIFVENNKNNIILEINGIKSCLLSTYNLKMGINNIQMIIKNNLTNLEYMFKDAKSLINIEGLKNLNTRNVKNFSYMFNGCSSLTNVNPLENWDVSNGTNFSGMFCDCSSLSNIQALQGWNVINVKNFSFLFSGCLSLSNIESLKNWNVLNGNDFSYMFYCCKSLSNIKPLEFWNVQNGKNFSCIFWECNSLSNLDPLKHWNVSNGTDFSYLFNRCSCLSDLKPLAFWNVSNGKNFSGMFSDCTSLIGLRPLENWNVSNGNNFTAMFSGCLLLSDIKSLEKWNVSKGNEFSWMFSRCPSLMNKTPLYHWNLSNRNYFLSMFS